MKNRTPYTYLIGWSKLDKYYYGRRTAKNCHPSEFWNSYFTSSVYVKQFREQYGEPDIIQIRKTFDNINNCKLWEEKFLTKVDARNNPKFLNRVNSDHKLNPIVTGPCSEKRRNSISKSRLKTKKIKCIHCNSQIDPGNFSQYHGEKCSKNPNINQQILLERKIKAKKSFKKSLERGTYHKPIPPKGNFICPHCNKNGTNWASMKSHHFDNCPKITKKPIPFPIRICCCIVCKKETNLGNLVRHKCII